MRLLVWTLVFIGMIMMFGCTDSQSPPPVDEISPEVRLLYPPQQVDDAWEVSDSISVYVGAIDNEKLTGIEVFFTKPDDTEREFVGASDTPISLASVPDTISSEFTLPQGWLLYRVTWVTLAITSGTEPQVFATALDASGNTGRSPLTTVSVFNASGDLRPPNPDFIISPPEGTVEDEFCFDASVTTDLITTDLGQIDVRWDFEGDGVWDLDWDAGVTADDVVCWTYSIARVYHPTLQAANRYFDEPSILKTRDLVIRPIGGDPDPEEDMEFVTLLAADYPRGTDSDPAMDMDEAPAHTARLSSEVQISRYEVSNDFYLRYVNKALATDKITFRNNKLFFTELAPPADSVRLFLDLENSRIFFNVDEDGFAIEPGFDDHPVTGVTWYGASAYGLFYGLRLPSEAEWEAAARGQNEGYRYPYGFDITDGDSTGFKRINYRESGDPFEDDRGTNPVGFFNGQPNEYGYETIDTGSPMIGLYDVSGNVAEWVRDWYGPYPEALLQRDPQGPSDGIYKVVRGGSYLNSPLGVRVTGRDGDKPPDESFPSIGFRVAFIVFIES